MSNEALRSCLDESSLYTLLTLSSRMLSQSGLGETVFMDRRTSRQKSRYGGFDLMCEGRIADLPVRTLVKIIRKDSIHLRMVDEMHGVVKRMKGDSGIIIATRHLTKGVKEWLATNPGSRVTVIDGTELAERLEKLGIGVRGNGDVDYQFFSHLEFLAPKAIEKIESLAHE